MVPDQQRSAPDSAARTAEISGRAALHPGHASEISKSEYQFRLDVTLGEATQTCTASWCGRELHLTTARAPLCLCWIDPFSGEIDEAAAETRIVAPMPGTVTRILAEVGAELARGAPLIVLEAMKMEHVLRAPADGHLKALKCAVGDFVQEGTDLADFDPAAEN